MKGPKRIYIDAEKKIYSDSEGVIRCEKCGMAVVGKLMGHTGRKGGRIPPTLHCPKCDPLPGDPK